MDAMVVFADYLKKASSLKEDEVELIYRHFRLETLKAEVPLFMAGQTYKKLVFVVEGVLRLFIIDENGDEVVKNFIEPSSFFVDFEGFDSNQPAVINVSAVTDCTLLTLSKADANELIGLLPQWEYLMKSGGIQAMNEMMRKQEFLLIGNSAQQYRHLVKHHPLLAQQVPLKYIASFLRITQSSLSRIRRQMD